MRTYLPEQLNCMEKLKKFKVGALFMQAGTGKTQAAVGIINSRTDIDKVLWFTPCRTKENLKEELEKCSLKYEVEIIGIETLSNSKKTYYDLITRYSNCKFFCVVDESIKIKNYSLRTQRITNIGKRAKYRLILNGTPLSKNYLDLYNQFNFLSEKIFKMNYNEFYSTFVIEKRVVKNRVIKKRWLDGFTNLDYLFSLISPFIYKSDLKLDVKKETKIIEYRAEDEIIDEYLHLKDIFIEGIKTEDGKLLGNLQKLQHSYAASLNKKIELKELLDRLKNEGVENKKIIIFYKYLVEEELLRNEFSDYTLLSLQKHTFGLNLQDSNIIIFYNISWDYALMEQAESRIYRTGQKEDCRIFYLISTFGLDEMIQDNLRKKENFLCELKQKTIQEFEEKL